MIRIWVKSRVAVLGIGVALLAACGGGSNSGTAGNPSGESASGGEGISSGEYPPSLIGKYADRDCAEAKMIEEAADLWPGFEIKSYEKTEQALTCAPLSVSQEGGGFKVSERCLVAGLNQQVDRETRYQVSGSSAEVTLDGQTTVYQKCPG